MAGYYAVVCSALIFAAKIINAEMLKGCKTCLQSHLWLGGHLPETATTFLILLMNYRTLDKRGYLMMIEGYFFISH